MADPRTAARADRNSVAGRVVLVTGGSTDIGPVTAQHLARLGASVVIAARDTSRVPDAAATLTRKHPTTVTAVAGDLASTADRAALIEKVIDRHGRLDALINNAGQDHVGSLTELDLLTDLDADPIGDLVEVNLTAIADLTRLALPHLHRRGGDVVMVSSAAAWLPVPPLMYSATKAGVDGLVAALRREQPRRIRIHSIQPGLVATEWLAYALGWRPSQADPHASTSLGIDPSRVAVQVQRCLTSSGHRTTSMPHIVGLGRVAGLPPLVHLLDLIGPVAAPRAVEWATRYGRFLTQDHGRTVPGDVTADVTGTRRWVGRPHPASTKPLRDKASPEIIRKGVA